MRLASLLLWLWFAGFLATAPVVHANLPPTEPLRLSIPWTAHIFSGGSSVEEKQNGATTVEYVRGSDFGGGVGGILYTLHGMQPYFTHYDRRGDVTVQTDGTGTITFQAGYSAFGEHKQETGATPDRQKANTKEEDPSGLLNEGFRYRDLETGSFITRDPAGFVDGPNLYTYVRQNPWTTFDPEGLWNQSVWTDREGGTLAMPGGDGLGAKFRQALASTDLDYMPQAIMPFGGTGGVFPEFNGD